MSRVIKHTIISTLICLECGNTFPIPRVNKKRAKNHIKTMYCPYCGKETDFIENLNINTVSDDIKEKLNKLNKP